MADYRNSSMRTVPAAGTRADIDQGLRSYMLQVYNYMAIGLALTGVAALASSPSEEEAKEDERVLGSPKMLGELPLRPDIAAA